MEIEKQPETEQPDMTKIAPKTTEVKPAQEMSKTPEEFYKMFTKIPSVRTILDKLSRL